MRNRFLSALALAGALLFLTCDAKAQTQTNVTATIADSDGIPYAGGTYSVQLVPTGTNPTVNGNSIGGAFNGSLDVNGSLNIALWANANIVPAGTQWQFTICSNPGGIASPLGTGNQCTPPTLVTVTGATQNLSTTLSAVAPKLTRITLGNGTVTSISATAPVVATPSPIIGTGTLSCPTCTTNASALTANSPMIGAGANAAAVGTATGNTTQFSTWSGATTATRCVHTDASGNLTVAAGDCGVALNPGGAAGTVQVNSGSSTFAGEANTLDCTLFAGADLGAKWNACITAAPSGSSISLANFTGNQTLSTAVTVNKTLNVYFGRTRITSQTAGITVSADGVTFRWGGVGDQTNGDLIKAANIDQITVSGTNFTINGAWIRGNASGGDTGSGLVFTNTAGYGAVIENSKIEDEVIGISSTGSGGTIFNTIFKSGTGAELSAVSFSGFNVLSSYFQPSVAGIDVIDIGSGTYKFDKINITDSVASTHLINITSGGNVYATRILAVNSAGNDIPLGGAGILVCTTCTISLEQSFIRVGAWPLIDASAAGASVYLSNNPYLRGGGASGPAISLNGGITYISGNQIVGAAGSDTILDVNLAANSVISNNPLISLAVGGQSGKCAVAIRGGGIGGVIEGNQINVTGGATATGDNYGVCLVPNSTLHLGGIKVTSNVVSMQSAANDKGFIFDNTSGNASGTFDSKNVFRDNTCVDCAFTIERIGGGHTDLVNMYQNNQGFGSGGYNSANTSVGDTIIETDMQSNTVFTFATLPSAGNGSIVGCSDCTQNTPTTSGGTGALLTRQLGVWSGNANAVSKTVVISADYTNATTGFTNVTGLGMPVLVSHSYTMHCALVWSASAASAGPQFQITGPAGTVSQAISMLSAVTSTTSASAATTSLSTPLNPVGAVVTSGTNEFAYVDMGITIGAAFGGTVQLQAAAEGAGTLTIRQGSYCELK